MATMEQIEIIDLAMRMMSKTDWNYRHKAAWTDFDYCTNDRMVRKVFQAVYGKPIDKDTQGVHWLARAALLQAIAHTGFFAPKLGFWTGLFYLYSFVSTVAGFMLWWYLFRGTSP